MIQGALKGMRSKCTHQRRKCIYSSIFTLCQVKLNSKSKTSLPLTGCMAAALCFAFYEKCQFPRGLWGWSSSAGGGPPAAALGTAHSQHPSCSGLPFCLFGTPHYYFFILWRDYLALAKQRCVLGCEIKEVGTWGLAHGCEWLSIRLWNWVLWCICFFHIFSTVDWRNPYHSILSLSLK